MATAGIKAAAYCLNFAPELALHYGGTPAQERKSKPDSEFLRALPEYAQTYEEAQAYAPNKTYIGAMSIAEVVAGMEAGADIIKVFPGELFGPKILKSIHGPIPQAELMPTGGVSLDNVAEWIAAGAVAVGAGGSLTAGAKTGDYGKITETARQFVEKIRAARGQ